MFEPPAKKDIDYALSILMHDVRRQVADEKNRMTLEAIKQGALNGSRFAIIIADAVDKIHATSLAQAKQILIDFVQRMDRPAPEITAWARPHLENLSNVALAGMTPNGSSNSRERVIKQYEAAFQQRFDGTLREVEIGYVRGSGFSTKTEMSDRQDWISAAQALALLGGRSSARTICKRAHAGLIRARAQRFVRDGRSADHVEIPAEFWWAAGHAALQQDWKTGDFDTWIDHRIHLQAFGVSFLRADIEKMVPPTLSQQSLASIAPVDATNGRSAIILTALDVETRAALRHLTDVHERIVRGGTVFHVGQFGQWLVAVAECGDGNVQAAATAERGINQFHPEAALFVGVAGGVKDVTIGDAVVSSKIYGYERGKDGEAGFRPRPAVNLPDYALEQRARAVRLKNDWEQRLNPNLQHSKPKIYVGAIAAGEKVVASADGQIAQFLREHYGDTLAVEMEGHGFLTGVHINAPVQGCVVRGISDLLDGKADADKTGSQERAADVASAVAFELLATLAPSQANASGNVVAS
jgi:nucleoside phosphorylase